MSEIQYDTSNPFIEYSSNRQYRRRLRTIFKINIDAIQKHLEQKYNTDELDDETVDELLYDTDTMEIVMQQLFERTKDSANFQILYDLAAAKMFSMDRTIGQCILFSYNYFYLFHACICVFLREPNEFTDTCTYYLQLKDKLEKK